MNQKPKFFWRGFLIVLPAILMAGYGLHTLREDREQLIIQAKEEASKLLDRLPETIRTTSTYESRTWQFGSAPEHSISFSSTNLFEISIASDGSFFPAYQDAPIRPSMNEDVLDQDQSEWWNRVNNSDNEFENTESILDLWNDCKMLIESNPPDYFKAHAYITILLLQFQFPKEFPGYDLLYSKYEYNLEQFMETLGNVPVAENRPASGQLLVELAQCKRQTRIHLVDLQELISHFALYMRSRFDFGTLQTLEEIALLIKEEALQKNGSLDDPLLTVHISADPAFIYHRLNHFIFLERKKRMSLDFHESVLKNKELLNLSDGQIFTVEHQNKEYHIWTDSKHSPVLRKRIWCAPVDELMKLHHPLQQWLDEMEKPAYLKLHLITDLRQRIDFPSETPLLAQSQFDGFILPPYRVAAVLGSPEILFNQFRERAFRLGGLLVLCLIAVMVGCWASWSAVRQQSELNASKSNFVASVSHELRTPIASIRLMAQELCEANEVSLVRAQKYHHSITRESRRLENMVENVLDASRIERGAQSYHKQITDITGLFKNAVEIMEPIARNNDLQLDYSIPDERIEAHVDGHALTRTLINLTDNAIKHSKPGTCVNLELRQSSDTIEIDVIDQGQGIPKSVHATIFEPFHRVGNELNRETCGVGLGLSIVNHMVKSHGGSITVRSEEGRGCQMTLRIPKV